MRRGGLESGAVGLLLGVALMLLLIVAVARQNLDEAPTRDSSYALFLVTLGLLHLMLRRHVSRAAVAIGAMGLGLDRLMLAAEAQQLPGAPVPTLAVWIGTALAVALVLRIGRLRLEGGGGAWVSGAHDLHD
jgi:peptidoglycan/LPS O-acetylase OafA/YrhL